MASETTPTSAESANAPRSDGGAIPATPNTSASPTPPAETPSDEGATPTGSTAVQSASTEQPAAEGEAQQREAQPPEEQTGSAAPQQSAAAPTGAGTSSEAEGTAGEESAPTAATGAESAASGEERAADTAATGQQAEDAASTEAAAASGKAEGTATAATGAEGAAADAEGGTTTEGKPKKKRRRRKRKKKTAAGDEGARPAAQPATDRAPFHVGEEVFGRVTAVLDTAIMVDLSGKALGIFDRAEMEPDDLVPDVGDRFLARVHQDGGRGGLVVLTRKPLREERAKLWVQEAAKTGTYVQGLVTGVIKGGVEVDIGGLRAFAPASGMDLHPQNANFTELLGQRLDFKVLQYEHNGRDVVVTRRPMLEAEAHERRKRALGLLEEGQTMRGIVRTVVEWGAFVALPDAENLEGLVHVTEASHEPRVNMAELFKPGQQIDVKITKIDERGKIWLSRKALIPDPWGDAKDKHPPGSKETGKVKRVEKFGAFVELEPGVEGLLHVQDMSSMQRVDDPNEIVKPGDEIEVVVHHFDTKNRRIGLHRAPAPEHADEAPQKVARNAAVKAEVVRGEQAGVRVRVLGATGRLARGFIPAGQTNTVRGTDLRKKFKPGTVIDAKIIDVDPKRGEPKLSIRQLAQDEERQAHREYRKKLARESGFGTLGDLFADKLRK